jgi:hypothetical protein
MEVVMEFLKSAAVDTQIIAVIIAIAVIWLCAGDRIKNWVRQRWLDVKVARTMSRIRRKKRHEVWTG